MDDVYEVLQNFKDVLQMIESRLDQMDEMYHGVDERFHNLESILFDDIINPAKEAMDNADREERFNGFHERNGEKLDGFNDSLKAIEGEDFDLSRQAFDDYDALEEPKPAEDEYVDSLVESVTEQLNNIKSALGVPEDSEVEAKIDENGDVEVAVDGEVVADENGEATEGEPTEATEDGATEEETVEETEEPELDENGEPVSDEEDLKALYEELEKAL